MVSAKAALLSSPLHHNTNIILSIALSSAGHNGEDIPSGGRRECRPIFYILCFSVRCQPELCNSRTDSREARASEVQLARGTPAHGSHSSRFSLVLLRRGMMMDDDDDGAMANPPLRVYPGNRLTCPLVSVSLAHLEDLTESKQLVGLANGNDLQQQVILI